MTVVVDKSRQWHGMAATEATAMLATDPARGLF